MNGSLLRGRLLVRIQSGSPKTPLKYSQLVGPCEGVGRKTIVGKNYRVIHRFLPFLCRLPKIAVSRTSFAVKYRVSPSITRGKPRDEGAF